MSRRVDEFYCKRVTVFTTMHKEYKEVDKYSSETDEELASKIGKSNDTAMFGVLYDRYEHLVYNKC
jgi:hypothetical protein